MASALAAEDRSLMHNRLARVGRPHVGPTDAHNAILPIRVGFIDRSSERAQCNREEMLVPSSAATSALPLASRNPSDAAGPSETFIVDNTAPTIAISAQSILFASGESVAFIITYADANFFSSDLSDANVHLITTGTASGTLNFDGGDGASRLVTISNISGSGTLSISIDAGSAADEVGHGAPAAGPSARVLQFALPAIAEDSTNAAGVKVADVLKLHFSDANPLLKPGIVSEVEHDPGPIDLRSKPLRAPLCRSALTQFLKVLGQNVR